MTFECIHCGEEIDTGELGHDNPKGEPFLVVRVRRQFREVSLRDHIHVECYEEVFDGDVTLPEWARE